jgi:hypothetical protein
MPSKVLWDRAGELLSSLEEVSMLIEQIAQELEI